jgi:Lar family restriction alleviation protein
MEEIKSCPFCGGVGELQNEGDWGTMFVHCLSCGADGAFVDSHDGCTEQDAISKWNKRI